MKIIISPAKKMNENQDGFPIDGLPRFLQDAKQICEIIRSMSYDEAKALWKCNDKLTQLNVDRYANMDLERKLTPAILSYEGLQYQHMAPVVFTEKAASYVREHLCILSGFYGVLSPFDGVTPYRLEMQAALSVSGHKDLYEFWGRRIYDAVLEEDRTIVNLASKEYSKVIERHLSSEDTMITVVFGELSDGKVRQKGTFAKMARGEMVRFLAEGEIVDLEKMKEFCVMGYEFSPVHSTASDWVFLKG